MGTKLEWVGERARREPKCCFMSIYHHVYNLEHLRSCYKEMEGGKAPGVDGVGKDDYGKNLEENLQDLSERLARMGYRPKPVKRVYIDKAGSRQKRPLGIPCFEDKLVQKALSRVLEQIYEEDFLPCSYGYRPGRSPHQCLDALGRTIQQKRVARVVEADIRAYFDTVNHAWMVKFLRHRIGDERVMRLVIRMLKSGIMEDGLVRATEQGTPQGSILSPLLSNIYLHYVLDLWFSRRVRKACRGEAYYFRYADDFLACFQYKGEAERFRQQLEDRLEGFGLKLAAEKTRSIEFGRFARENAYKRGEKPNEFTFLGFTHYSGKTQEGYFKVKRRTSRKKLGSSLREFTDWAKKARCVMCKGEMLRAARRRIIGHLNYYAITDNSQRCSYYVHRTTQILFKWINRKSQRRAYTWADFNQALIWVKWPKARIRKDLDPCRRAEAHRMAN